MRVLFWGTPEFATPPLRALLGEGFDVVGVVTQPDKPVGRSRSTLQPPPVKLVALEENVPVLQPERPRGDDFLAQLRALAPDVAARLLGSMESLRAVDGAKRATFAGALTAALKECDVSPGAPLLKAIWAAVSVADPDGELQTDRKGDPLPDPDLRDNENVPLGEDVDEYLAREVLPHVPDAWIDHSKTKVGYEIPFTRHFYVYTPPRLLEEIDADLKSLEAEIQRLLGQVTS